MNEAPDDKTRNVTGSQDNKYAAMIARDFGSPIAAGNDDDNDTIALLHSTGHGTMSWASLSRKMRTGSLKMKWDASPGHDDPILVWGDEPAYAKEPEVIRMDEERRATWNDIKDMMADRKAMLAKVVRLLEARAQGSCAPSPPTRSLVSFAGLLPAVWDAAPRLPPLDQLAGAVEEAVARDLTDPWKSPVNVMNAMRDDRDPAGTRPFGRRAGTDVRRFQGPPNPAEGGRTHVLLTQK